jgi:cytochrome c553
MKKTLILSLGLFVALMTTVHAADAKANWKEHCAKCHGEDGKGKTTMGRKLKIKDYTDAKVQAEFKDEAMFKAIKEGVKKDGKTRMKDFTDKLKDDEIKGLVKFVREFKK